MNNEHIESHSDRILRLKYLETLLRLADNVWLFGIPEKTAIFLEYLKQIFQQANIKQFNYDSEISLGKYDIVMPITTDTETFKNIFRQLNNAGVSPIQIVSPVFFYFPFLAEKEGFIYPLDEKNIQLPILATIDTVNACNLDCATCLKPGWQENGERMEFELFKDILDKVCLMGVREVELYNYTEPFLNPKIYDFMAEVKRRHLALGISTNLSISNIPHLKECVDLLENGDWFVITISGVSQEIYEINHRRGKIGNVIENIKKIAKSDKRNIVRLRLLDFEYNRGEMALAKKIADENGLSFEVFPAERNPFNFDVRKQWEQYICNGITYNDYDKSSLPDGFYCPFIHSRNIVINHRGNVELCCRDVTRPYDLGSFLDQDISVIQMKRTMHPLCHSCIHQHEAPGEWEALRKYFPVNVDCVSEILQHAMYTITHERVLAPRSFMPELKSDNEFIYSLIKKLSIR